MGIEEVVKNIELIADTFGLKSQQLKLIEELGELTRELSKDIANNRSISDNTLSEIADVKILINQILYLVEKEDINVYEKLRSNTEYKLKRTIQRINTNYYK